MAEILNPVQEEGRIRKEAEEEMMGELKKEKNEEIKTEKEIEKNREESQKKTEKKEEKESWKRTKWALGKGKTGAHAVFKNTSALGFFLFLVLAAHIIDISGYQNFGIRIIAYSVLLLFAGFIVLDSWIVTLGIGVLAFFFAPGLTLLLGKTALSYSISVIIFAFPIWWAFILLASPPENPSKGFTFVKNIYLVALFIIFVIYLLIPGLAIAGISKQELVSGIAKAAFTSNGPAGQVRQVAGDVGKAIYPGVPNLVSQIWEQQINIATGGDYYAGQVEQNKKEPIGVYIENLRQADPTLYADQPIIIWATLKAKTILDRDISIYPACRASDKYKELVNGAVNNKENPKYTVTGYEQIDLQCEFSPNVLAKGSHQVNFTALFNLDTFSYMKAHFMERQRLLDLKRQGIDPLEQYKITEKIPTAVFTNGPVGIGMDLPDMPIGIATDEENVVLPTLGVTIENRWEGRIKKIKRILLYVPEGLALANCDHPMVQVTQLEDADKQDGYAAFTFANPNDPITTDIANQVMGGYRTFKCRIRTIADPAKVLGAAPIITKNFKLTISYDYELVKSLPIEVKEGFGKAYIPVTTVVPSIPQSPTTDDAKHFQNLFDTTKYNDRTYTQILQSTSGGKDNHELLAAIIVVETGVQNVDASQTKRKGCTGIAQMCGALATQMHLCDGPECKAFDYRMQVDRQMSALASYLLTLKSTFTSPLNYNDKEKFAIASYISGNAQIIKTAISNAQIKGDVTQTATKWEEITPFITKELLAQFPEYQSMSDDDRAKKAEEIKSYVPFVLNYKTKFHDSNSFS